MEEAKRRPTGSRPRMVPRGSPEDGVYHVLIIGGGRSIRRDILFLVTLFSPL